MDEPRHQFQTRLLRRLWDHARPTDNPACSFDASRAILSVRGQINYFCGRWIGVDFSSVDVAVGPTVFAAYDLANNKRHGHGHRQAMKVLWVIYPELRPPDAQPASVVTTTTTPASENRRTPFVHDVRVAVLDALWGAARRVHVCPNAGPRTHPCCSTCGFSFAEAGPAVERYIGLFRGKQINVDFRNVGTSSDREVFTDYTRANAVDGYAVACRGVVAATGAMWDQISSDAFEFTPSPVRRTHAGPTPCDSVSTWPGIGRVVTVGAWRQDMPWGVGHDASTGHMFQTDPLTRGIANSRRPVPRSSLPGALPPAGGPAVWLGPNSYVDGHLQELVLDVAQCQLHHHATALRALTAYAREFFATMVHYPTDELMFWCTFARWTRAADGNCSIRFENLTSKFGLRLVAQRPSNTRLTAGVVCVPGKLIPHNFVEWATQAWADDLAPSVRRACQGSGGPVTHATPLQLRHLRSATRPPPPATAVRVDSIKLTPCLAALGVPGGGKLDHITRRHVSAIVVAQARALGTSIDTPAIEDLLQMFSRVQNPESVKSQKQLFQSDYASQKRLFQPSCGGCGSGRPGLRCTIGQATCGAELGVVPDGDNGWGPLDMSIGRRAVLRSPGLCPPKRPTTICYDPNLYSQ